MPAVVTLAALNDLHARVMRHVVWTADRDVYNVVDDWRSFTAAVRSGKITRDDCDAIAMTWAELARDDLAVPEDRIRLVFCFTETGAGHLICLIGGVERDDGQVVTIALDNRQRKAMDWRWLRSYRMDRGMWLSEPGVWRKIDRWYQTVSS